MRVNTVRWPSRAFACLRRINPPAACETPLGRTSHGLCASHRMFRMLGRGSNEAGQGRAGQGRNSSARCGEEKSALGRELALPRRGAGKGSSSLLRSHRVSISGERIAARSPLLFSSLLSSHFLSLLRILSRSSSPTFNGRPIHQPSWRKTQPPSQFSLLMLFFSIQVKKLIKVKLKKNG